jgi:3-hydroxy-9,10-secoandrosta-1,3,5(10)-triene-9,17-dione monooxygenase reductase component
VHVDQPMSIDIREFRNALGAFATGVTIVTTRTGEGVDVGVTVNSFNSVSLDPPLVLWSLARASSSLKAFDEAAHFAIHILAADQEGLSNRFAQRGVDKFAAIPILRGRDAIPLLDGCCARFQCQVVYRYEGGDHVIFVGEVVDFEYSGRKPLAYLGGRYAFTLHKPVLAQERHRDIGSTHFNQNWLSFLTHRISNQFIRRHRPTLSTHGLNEVDGYLLTLLLLRKRLSPREEINELIDNPCMNVSLSLAGLMDKGLAVLDESGTTVSLSEKGRRMAIDLVAATKVIEEEAEQGLEPEEVQLFKALLHKTINNLDIATASPR